MEFLYASRTSLAEYSLYWLSIWCSPSNHLLRYGINQGVYALVHVRTCLPVRTDCSAVYHHLVLSSCKDTMSISHVLRSGGRAQSSCSLFPASVFLHRFDHSNFFNMCTSPLSVEDLTACDGAGGQDFRERLNMRWKASLPFRQLLEDLTLYIGLGFLAQTILQTVVLFTTQEIVFVAVSTFILWGWCGLSAFLVISYTKRALREEKLWWAEEYKNRQPSGISKAQMA